MKNKIKKVITFMLVLTMIMSIFAPYSLVSATQVTQEDIPDALITGFSYVVDGTDSVTKTFAELDGNTDGTYSAYIDIPLETGAKSVVISDILESIANEEGYELTVTPSDRIVDVSAGKGIVEFDAKYSKNGIEKRNYYIVRFMVAAPVITDFDTPIAEDSYKLENKPFDYFTQYPFVNKREGSSNDGNAWMLSYVGDEIYNSYLLVQSKQDSKGVSDEDTLNAAAPEKPYMYKFTAPADGKLIVVAQKPATSTAWSTSDFKLVSGDPSLPLTSSQTVDYNYKNTTFWHTTGSVAKTYTAGAAVKFTQEEKTTYNFEGTVGTDKYRPITAALDGISEILTKPYDYRPTATQANSYAEDYMFLINHPYDKVATNTLRKYVKDNNITGTDASVTVDRYSQMLKDYRNDPTKDKPVYIESGNAAAPGMGTNVINLMPTVYTKIFKAGDTVEIPYYYKISTNSTAGYSPIVFVSWEKLATDTNAVSLTATIDAETSGTLDRVIELDVNELEHDIELEYNDASVKIALAANDYRATVSYTDVDGNALSSTTIPAPEAGATTVIYATITAEDPVKTRTYKLNITRNADATEYPRYTTTNGSIMIEAEDVVVDEESAVINSDSNASGGQCVNLEGYQYVTDPYVQPNTSQGQLLPEAPGYMGFKLSFDQTGRYSIWVRYKATSSDSAWIDYGQIQARTKKKGYSNVDFIIDKSAYQWERIAVIAEQENATQTVRIRTREAGIKIDKFIITKYFGYEPTGIGELDPDKMLLVAKMPEDRYPMPSITPTKGEHPRVLFKAEDIPTIKENMNAPENAAIVSRFNTLKERTDYTGILPNKDPNHDGTGLEIILSKAFDYAIFGNEEHGREAISIMKNYANTLQVDTPGDNCRQKGQVLKTIGEVYDWCYLLLTTQDKEDLMYYAQIISAGMECEFPPDTDNIFCGHGAEYQIYRDWLTMAIACYDEYEDAYNFVGGKVFSSDSVDYRNWWNQSGTHSQGSSYGPQTRYKAELFAHILIKRMSGQPLFNEYDLTKIAYEWIYRRRPDGLLMIDGDDNTPNLTPKGNYVNSLNYVTFLASVINGDPILKSEFAKEGGMATLESGREAVLPIEMLILNDPNVEANIPVSSLPLTAYHASPVGEMVARTGWNMGVDSNDVVATMTMNEYNPMNHGHYDSGHFMIYYKGILANDSGWYEKHDSDHQRTYMSQSIAHNTLIIETPYNTWGNQNQGIDGLDVNTSADKNFCWLHDTWAEYQAEEENRFAEIMGHEFGPDIQYPEYTYLAGDMANAYTSDQDTDVEEALRHMIFLPTGDEKNPAAFVVFDKIKTKTAGNKKAFMLHMEEEPEVYDNITIIKRTELDYNGKLVNQTLLPASNNLKIDEIGGVVYDADGNILEDKRFWNKDQNWPFLQDMGLAIDADENRKVDPNNSLEAGWGRVEIMPKNSSNVDYMLNVMYVGEADDNSAVEEAILIETDSFAGAKIFDRVVMFNKEKTRTDEAVCFTVPGDEEALKVNVAGLKAGTWTITVNDSEIGTQVSSNDGGIIYFTASAGSYTLTYTDSKADKEFENSGAPYEIDEELIVGFSYAVDNCDKEYVSFETYDKDKNHSQMFDITKLPVGTKTVTISDIIKSDSVIEGGYDLKITPSSGVVDVSSGKGIVEICATAPAGTIATDVNKYIIRFIVDAPQVMVTSPVEKSNYTWKDINEPLDQTKHYLYSDLSSWYAGYVGKEIYDSHLFIIPGRSASTRKLDKTTVQTNYETKYIQEHPDATEDDIAKAIEENASYLYKFEAPASGTLYLVSNTEPGLELEGYTRVEGNPASTTEWTEFTTNYTYTQNSFYHVKGQLLKGYKKQNSTAVELSNYPGMYSILTKPYDYIPPATEANSYAENYFVTAYHPADNGAKSAWKNYKSEHYDEFLGSLESDGYNWTGMLNEYKKDPTSEKPKYIESSNSAAPGLCANIVCNSVVYKKTFNRGEKVIVPFYYETAPSLSTVYNPIVFVSWDALSADVNAKSLTVGDDSFDVNVFEHNVELEYNENSATIKLVPRHADAEVSYTDGDGVALSNSVSATIQAPEIGETKVVKAIITAQDGTSATYTLNITKRARSTALSVTVPNNIGNNMVAYKLSEEAEYGDAEVSFADTVKLGTVYYLKAVASEGYEFRYWKIISNSGISNIFSDEEEIEYTANLNSTLEAVFVPKESEEKFVSFINKNGQLIGEYTIDKNSKRIPITTPIQTGHKFENWLRKDTNETYTFEEELSYTSDAIAGANDIIFIAQYAVSDTLYTVTVENGYIYAADGDVYDNKPISEKYTYNTPIVVRTEEEGIFSHWIKGKDEKAQIASYSPEYKFYVTTADVDVKAVYVADEALKEADVPFIIISDVVKDTNNGGKIQFFSERHLPDDCTFIGAGITVGQNNADIDETTTGAGIYQYTAKNQNANQFVATKINAQVGTWTARAWLMYKDASGNIKTIYSEKVSESL